jgi:hypothetical protein
MQVAEIRLWTVLCSGSDELAPHLVTEQDGIGDLAHR